MDTPVFSVMADAAAAYDSGGSFDLCMVSKSLCSFAGRSALFDRLPGVSRCVAICPRFVAQRLLIADVNALVAVSIMQLKRKTWSSVSPLAGSLRVIAAYLHLPQ